jgi:hypothetical protein
MALKRVSIPSPNYSSRGGAGVRLIVLHTSEGAQSYQSLGAFFGKSSSQVSSHVGIDDTPATVGEYVGRNNKAWTAANANPVAVQAELCTPSGAADHWTTDVWNSHPMMLANTAAWIAEEAAAFGIPIVKLSPAQAQGSSRGVCQHSDLGSWGGGHHDCGPGFPIDQVLAMATGQPAPSPIPTPPVPPPVAPPWPGRYLKYPPLTTGSDVQTWQQQMAHRGWTIGVDGQYGPQSKQVCTQFQQEKGLGVDGVVGPQTWNATWTAPVT